MKAVESTVIRQGATVAEIQRIDKIAIEKIGIPSVVLMENAGRAVAREVQRVLKGKRRPRVCVVCGLGNNAGDGFVAARYLRSVGTGTKIFLIGEGRQLKHDAAVNYQILKKIKYPIIECRGTKFCAPAETIAHDIARADIVVDAIFGVGLNRQIEEPFRGVMETINREAKYVVSVDIPSGLDGTTGKVYGTCIKADVTVTFSFAKRGFFLKEGPAHAGRIVVADIGIPKELKGRVVHEGHRCSVS